MRIIIPKNGPIITPQAASVSDQMAYRQYDESLTTSRQGLLLYKDQQILRASNPEPAGVLAPGLKLPNIRLQLLDGTPCILSLQDLRKLVGPTEHEQRVFTWH